MNWHNPQTTPPPVGKRVIARCAGFTGEAYLSVVGGKPQWMRSYNVPWEAWAKRPVEEWTEMDEHEDDWLSEYIKKGDAFKAETSIPGYCERVAPLWKIKNIAAEDVVPVVRCKDCKHAYKGVIGTAAGTVICELATGKSNGSLIEMEYNDYCSYGRKRENGTD